MSEKNDVIVKNNWKDDLRLEAKEQCKSLANSVAKNLSVSASGYAQYAVKRIFDEFIDYMNKKLFA